MDMDINAARTIGSDSSISLGGAVVVKRGASKLVQLTPNRMNASKNDDVKKTTMSNDDTLSAGNDMERIMMFDEAGGNYNVIGRKRNAKESKEVIDRPLLLVNWTLISNGKVVRPRNVDDDETMTFVGGTGKEAWDDDTDDEQEDINDKETSDNDDDDDELVSGDSEFIRAEIVVDIHSDFDNKAEELFERGLAYHTTASLWETHVNALEDVSTDYFGVVEYPETVGDMFTSSMWRRVTAPTEWNAVTALKRCIAECSRTLSWKVFISLEVENLALQHLILGKEATSTKAPVTSIFSNPINEDVNTDSDKLNVIDRIIAMVFERTPSHLLPGNISTEGCKEYYEVLGKKHLILKDLWISSFGGLPSDDLWNQ